MENAPYASQMSDDAIDADVKARVIDAFIADVEARVDFVAKAHEARSKPLTEQQIAAYGDYPPYGTNSALVGRR